MKTPNNKTSPIKRSKSATPSGKRVWHTNMRNQNLNDLPYSPGSAWKNALEEAQDANDNEAGSFLRYRRSCRYIPESLKGNRQSAFQRGAIVKLNKPVARPIFKVDDEDSKLRSALEDAMADRSMSESRFNFVADKRAGATLRQSKPSTMRTARKNDTLRNSDTLNEKAKYVNVAGNNNENNDKTNYNPFTPKQQTSTRDSIDEGVGYEIDIIGDIPDPKHFEIYESNPGSPTTINNNTTEMGRDLDASNNKRKLATDDDDVVAQKTPLNTITLKNTPADGNTSGGEKYEIDIHGSIPDPEDYTMIDKENSDMFAGKRLPKVYENSSEDVTMGDIIGGYSVHSEDGEYEIDTDYILTENVGNNKQCEVTVPLITAQSTSHPLNQPVQPISSSSVAEHIQAIEFLSTHRTIVNIKSVLPDAVIRSICIVPIGEEMVYDQEENCYILRADGIGWIAIDGGFGWYAMLTRRDGVKEVLGDIRDEFMVGSRLVWMAV